MYKRILVPLDGSPLAEAVLPHAVAIAKKFRAELCLLRVVSLTAPASLLASAGALADPSMGSAVEAEILAQAHEEELAAARQYVEELSQRLQRQRVQTCLEVVEGSAAEAIMEYAHNNHIDLIALSTHGRTGIVRLVLGSVTDQIVRRCRCPVLLIRPS